MVEEPVQRITTARRPHSEDVAGRMRNYAIAMAIRTACVVSAALIDHWTRWLFVPAAILLPYLAVLVANAGRERAPAAPATFVVGPVSPEPTRELPTVSRPDDDPDPPGGRTAPDDGRMTP